MIVKKECLYQETIKGSDIDTFCTWIQKEKIRHYGFAFEGKKILIGTRE